jgi:hypothetical protein
MKMVFDQKKKTKKTKNKSIFFFFFGVLNKNRPFSFLDKKETVLFFPLFFPVFFSCTTGLKASKKRMVQKFKLHHIYFLINKYPECVVIRLIKK